MRLCGNQLPAEPIISTGSRMLLTYKTSEHSPLHTGFLAAYEGKENEIIQSKRAAKHLNLIIAVCGGELNMESGQLESPNYPEDYVPNKECIWVITVPVGFQVALKFQSFEVSEST